MKFGDWTFIKESDRKYYYTVQCKCGLIKDVQRHNLRRGQSTKCFKCYHESRVVHGFARKIEDSRVRPGLYGVWEGMKSRCLNPQNTSYKNYGGRGIKICERWLDFKNFNDDMSTTYIKGLQLDRIDNNSGYSKENCRWVTAKQNARNRRDCRLITYKGETKTVSEWAEKLGFFHQTLSRRIDEWGIEKAIDTPLQSMYVRSKHSTTKADSNLS